ncbi:MAG TPA: PKD domain-containing protein [Vicinamibacterales bacterium]|nr:PKD domain-containing protein [Vicinamibacterales bacterium]
MTIRTSRSSRLAAPAIALSVLALAACTVQKQSSAPPLSGPSSLGLTLSLSASPDILPRDGSSKSTITISTRDASNNPTAQRVTVNTSVGTLSEPDVTTNSSGVATVQLTAPSINSTATSATITVTPVEAQDVSTQTSVSHQIVIALLGPDVPVPSFTSSPDAPGQYDLVTFDASATTVNNLACGSACTYAWDFGDGSTGSGQVVTHRFSSQGGFNVTLTVTHEGASATKNAIVTIGAAQTITAAITFSPTDPVTTDKVFFDGSGSKTPDGIAITTYAWDFGNGDTASGATASEKFSDVRTYTVRLTVTDALGRTATTTVTVKVAKAS